MPFFGELSKGTHTHISNFQGKSSLTDISYFPPSTKMTVATAKKDKFRVPTIDISLYVQDPTSLEASKVIAQVREACMTTGFFELVGHGVERSLQDQVFEAGRRLFSLPYKEKEKMDRKLSGLNNRGYELMGTQVLQQDAGADQKEVRYLRTASTLSFRRTLTYQTRASTSPRISQLITLR